MYFQKEFLLTIVLTMCMARAGFGQTWSNVDKTKSVEATFVNFENDQVTMLLPNGKLTKTAISRFCILDQLQILSISLAKPVRFVSQVGESKKNNSSSIDAPADAEKQRLQQLAKEVEELANRDPGSVSLNRKRMELAIIHLHLIVRSPETYFQHQSSESLLRLERVFAAIDPGQFSEKDLRVYANLNSLFRIAIYQRADALSARIAQIESRQFSSPGSAGGPLDVVVNCRADNMSCFGEGAPCETRHSPEQTQFFLEHCCAPYVPVTEFVFRNANCRLKDWSK